jgi:hypothetical protein
VPRCFPRLRGVGAHSANWRSGSTPESPRALAAIRSIAAARSKSAAVGTSPASWVVITNRIRCQVMSMAPGGGRPRWPSPPRTCQARTRGRLLERPGDPAALAHPSGQSRQALPDLLVGQRHRVVVMRPRPQCRGTGARAAFATTTVGRRPHLLPSAPTPPIRLPESDHSRTSSGHMHTCSWPQLATYPSVRHFLDMAQEPID